MDNNLARYERFSKYKKIKKDNANSLLNDSISIGVFALSMAAAISNSAILISMPTTNKVFGVINLVSGIKFNGYFFRELVLDNAQIKKISKILKKPIPKSIKQISKSELHKSTFSIKDKNENKSYRLELIGGKEVLECLKKILIEFSNQNICHEIDLKLDKPIESIHTKSFKDYYQSRLTEVDITRKLLLKVSPNEKALDKVVISSRALGAIGFFVESLRKHGLEIEDNKDKSKLLSLNEENTPMINNDYAIMRDNRQRSFSL